MTTLSASSAFEAQTSRDGIWYDIHGGEGDWVVLLHGFPASSDDWDGVLSGLARNHRVLRHDMLGYGRSAKPADADYSVKAHAERLLGLMQLLGIERASFVGHDLGGIVLQQLMYLSSIRNLPVQTDGVVFMNSGVYHRFSQPTLIQRLLTIPVLGHFIASKMTVDRFSESMRKVWGDVQPSQRLLDGMWRMYSCNAGLKLSPIHLQYIAERRKNGDLWMSYIEKYDKPMALIWGKEDPVSGGAVLDHARVRLPKAVVTELKAGHFPQVEQPQAVERALLKWLDEVKVYNTSNRPTARNQAG